LIMTYRNITDPLSSFSFNPPYTTHFYTLSLHDALPILLRLLHRDGADEDGLALLVAFHQILDHGGELRLFGLVDEVALVDPDHRSEEHTSELQSLAYLVCRLLLEKKNINKEKRIFNMYI